MAVILCRQRKKKGLPTFENVGFLIERVKPADVVFQSIYELGLRALNHLPYAKFPMEKRD